MKIDEFVQGHRLQYGKFVGEVNFIGPEYITLTVSRGRTRATDCNLLVYHWYWDQLIPVPV